MQLNLDPDEMAVLCGALMTAQATLGNPDAPEMQGMPTEMRVEVNEAVDSITKLLAKCEGVLLKETGR